MTTKAESVAALIPQPLTKDAFAPFGTVIETAGAAMREINQGFAKRFHDLAAIDVSAEGGAPLLSIFEARPRPRPLRLPLLERHPLGSQSFFPLDNTDWLAVVAPDADGAPDWKALRVFRARGRQGLTYARGTWHAPLLVLDAAQRFLVVDRGGPAGEADAANLQEAPAPPDAPVLTV